MKKILFILLFSPLLSLGQFSKQSLTNQINNNIRKQALSSARVASMLDSMNLSYALVGASVARWPFADGTLYASATLSGGSNSLTVGTGGSPLVSWTMNAYTQSFAGPNGRASILITDGATVGQTAAYVQGETNNTVLAGYTAGTGIGIHLISNNAESLYIDQSGDWKVNGAFGTNTQVLTRVSGKPQWAPSSGGYSTIQNNGSSLTQRSNLNFTTGLTAVDDAGNTRTNITISSLPNGVTATTQSALDNSTKVATTAYVDAAAGSGAFWSLATGGTLSAINTITSNRANGIIETGTFNATASTDFLKRITGTQTANSAGGVTTLLIDPSLVASGTSSVQVAVDVNPIFSGGTTPSNLGFRVRSGKSVFGGNFTPLSTDIHDVMIRNDNNIMSGMTIVNNVPGTAAGAEMMLSVSSTLANYMKMQVFSSSYSTAGVQIPISAVLSSLGLSGGMSVGTYDGAALALFTGGVKRLIVGATGQITYNQQLLTSGFGPGITLVPGNHTSITAATENRNFQMSTTTQQWTGGGSWAATGQRFNIWGAPTMTATSATTIGRITNVYFQKAIAGTNISGTPEVYGIETEGIYIASGNLKYVDGNQAATKVLTSDANGVASWQPASGGGGSGTVTSVSGVNTNNVTFSIATATSTPAITISTTGTPSLSTDFVPKSYVDGLTLPRADATHDGYLNGATDYVRFDAATSTRLVTNGGTGITSYTIGNMTYASGATTISLIAPGTTGQTLGNASGVPTWGTTSITQTAGDNTTNIATTAFVTAAITANALPAATDVTDGYLTMGDHATGIMLILADATDAAFTMSANAVKYLPAATLTVTRAITIPTGNNGDRIELANNEAGFAWTLTGGSVYLADGSTIVTTLLANTNYILRKISGKWRIMN